MHTGTGQAVHGHGGELLLEHGAQFLGRLAAGGTGVGQAVVDGVDDIVAVSGELVGHQAVHLLLELGDEGLGCLIGSVGIEGGHQNQALGQSGVEAFHGQDAVHAVTAEELGSVADLVGVGQNLRSLGVVDRQEHQISTGVLALGHLGGQVGLVVGGEGSGGHNLNAQLSGLLAEALVQAGGVVVGGVVDDTDLGTGELGGYQLSGGSALVGVGEAHLEDVVTGQSQRLGGGGGSQVEHVVGGGLGSHSQSGTGGNLTGHDLHTPVLQHVVSGNGLLAVSLIVLSVELDLQTALGVDFLNGHFHAGLHGQAIGGGAAGQRAGHADLHGAGTGRSRVTGGGSGSRGRSSRGGVAAAGKDGCHQDKSHGKSKILFHFRFLLF